MTDRESDPAPEIILATKTIKNNRELKNNFICIQISAYNVLSSGSLLV